jgi:hypothetical protein
MDGFKNTTKTSYDTSSGRKFANGGMTVSRNDMAGGQGPMNKPAMVAKYAKGGTVKKADQKIGRVMTEFTEGKLHSGSKEGPKVKSTKQAVAIALNEARAAGAKIPRVKKNMGGPVKMREGGVYNERGQRATWDEVAAEGRRVEGRKRPAEGISTRPTDDSGRRMTNEELGMTPGGVDPAKKKAMPKGMGAMSNRDAERAKEAMKRAKGMSDLERARMMATRPLPRKEGGGVPAHSDRPMIRRAMGGLTAMPKGKC